MKILSYRTSEVTDNFTARAELPNCKGGSASLASDMDFYGASVEEYKSMINSGWQAGVEAISADLEANTQAVSGYIMEQDVAGFYPDIAEYLTGEPEYFIRFEEGKSEAVNLFVPLRFNASYDASEIMDYGRAVLATLTALEAQGLNVNLYAVQKTKYDGLTTCKFIQLSSYTELFDLDSVSQCFHPSFYRRALFALKETSKFKAELRATHGGYGRPEGISSDDVAQAVSEGAIYNEGANIILPDITDSARSLDAHLESFAKVIKGASHE